MFLQKPDVAAQCVLEARDVVVSLKGQLDAGVGVGRQYFHSYEDFRDIRDRGSTTLVIFSEPTLSFLDVDENVSKSPGGRWGHNGFVSVMQLCFTSRADGYYNASPCVEAVTGLHVVKRYLFFTV